MKATPIILLAAVPVAVGACSKGQDKPTVVVYTSVDDIFARPVAEQFQNATGIEVKLVPDTEETKSAGLLNRLIAEQARPQCDVFWSGDPVRAGILKSKGVSAAYLSPAADGLPPQFSDPQRYFTSFSTRVSPRCCRLGHPASVRRRPPSSRAGIRSCGVKPCAVRGPLPVRQPCWEECCS